MKKLIFAAVILSTSAAALTMDEAEERMCLAAVKVIETVHVGKAEGHPLSLILQHTADLGPPMLNEMILDVYKSDKTVTESALEAYAACKNGW